MTAKAGQAAEQAPNMALQRVKRAPTCEAAAVEALVWSGAAISRQVAQSADIAERAQRDAKSISLVVKAPMPCIMTR